MPNLVDRLAGASSSLAFKAPCRLATTANITLSGMQTIDGVLPTSTEHVDLRRILVKNQTTASQNGIYIMDTGVWERTKDFDGANDFRQGTRVFVWGGSTQSGGYVITSSMNPSTFVFDTDTITWTAQAAVDITNWQFADNTGLYDNSGNEQLLLRKSSSAANYIEVWNQAAGGPPAVASQGSDTNVNLLFTTKGTGNLVVQSGYFSRNMFAVVDGSTAAVNYLTVANSSSGSGPTVAPLGSDTNIDIKFTAKGSGSITSSSPVSFGSSLAVTGGIAASSGITASGSITSSNLTASGLITGSAGISVNSTFTSSGAILAVTGTTVMAGGVVGKGVFFGGTTNFGIYYGSGAPTIAAAAGSWYIRTDGGTSLTRAYIQSSGSSATWVGLLTTA
jgi:hypothetical protein